CITRRAAHAEPSALQRCRYLGGARYELCIFSEDFHLYRSELGEQFFDVFLAGRSTRLATPFGGNARLLQDPADMILFEDAHVAAHFVVGDLNPVTGE